MKLLKKTSPKGASGVEYGIIVGLVGVLAIVAVRNVGVEVKSAFDTAARETNVLCSSNTPPLVTLASDRSSDRTTGVGGVFGPQVVWVFDVTDEQGDQLRPNLIDDSENFEAEISNGQLTISTARPLNPGTYPLQFNVIDRASCATEDTEVQELSLTVDDFGTGIENGSFDTAPGAGFHVADGWETFGGEPSVFEFIAAGTPGFPDPVSSPYLIDMFSSSDEALALDTPALIAQQSGIRVDPHQSYELSVFVASPAALEPGTSMQIGLGDEMYFIPAPSAPETWVEQTFRIEAFNTSEVDMFVIFNGAGDNGVGMAMDDLVLRPVD